MSRAVPEWIGKTDDTPVPPRVKERICVRYAYLCGHCGNYMQAPVFDHIVALINGGANAEGNIQPLHAECHAMKTKADVKVKSKVARVRKKHLGLSKPKRTIPGRRFNGDPIPSRVRP